MTPDRTPQPISRRKVLALAAAAATTGMMSSCMPRPQLPSERSISFGFENIVTDRPRWEHFGDRLRRVNANAVSISVGRTDWTAFPWDGHPDAAPSAVTSTGRDYVQEAIDALQPRLADGQQLTLTMDTLAPVRIKADPGIAGTNPCGKSARSFPSVSSLSDGTAGDLLVVLADTICSRYRPDRVSLTELMFDDYTFGEQDLRSYLNHTGAADWPRTEDGSIDTSHFSLGIWRSAALASLLARIKSAASGHGVQLDMDVRAPWTHPDGDRPLSGHSYDILLSAADRIVVWNYFAINGSGPEYGGRIADSLQRRFPGRYVMSTGLWADHGTVGADLLETSLKALSAAKASAVSITPVSMMSDAHWDVLARLWAPR